jgi:hypothetical protein
MEELLCEGIKGEKRVKDRQRQMVSLYALINPKKILSILFSLVSFKLGKSLLPFYETIP